MTRDEDEEILIQQFQKKFINRTIDWLIIKEIVETAYGFGQQSIMDEYRENQLKLVGEMTLNTISKLISKPKLKQRDEPSEA